MFDPESIRSDFPILNTHIYGKPLIYFDNAATSQKPLAVIDKIVELYSSCNANIHRGIHYLSEETTLRYEHSREVVRDYIGAKTSKEIIFTHGATEAINLVAQSFGERYFHDGDNIIISRMEHHSNIVPWTMVAQRLNVEIRILELDNDGRLQIENLEKLIDAKTKIVALTHTSNVLGTNNPIDKIVTIAHNNDVPVLIDGCQGIIHNSIDVSDLDIDFYVFSGHKIYAPTGIGVLYGKEKWLEQMPPYQGGGDMISSVSLENGVKYAELPLKFEAGTTNYIGAIAMATAIEYIKERFNDTHKHTNLLMQIFTNGINDIAHSTIYGTTLGKAPIVSFTIDNIHPMDLVQIVDKLGVALRSGTHCAEPLLTRYGVKSMIRASFAPYNTMQEVEKSLEAINKAVNMLK